MESKFRIQVEAEHFVKVLKLMKELLVDVEFVVDTNGVSVVCMDPANVAMVCYKLLGSSCADFKVTEPRKFIVNVEMLHNALKKADKKDVMVLEEQSDKLLITLKGKNTKTIKHPMIADEDRREQKRPELSFKAEVVTDSTQFRKEMEFIKGDCSVKFVLGNEKEFKLMTTNDLSQENEIVFKADNSARIGFSEDSYGKYSVEYLMKMVEASILSDEVKIRFSDNYPLSLVYGRVDCFEMEFILAPRTDE
jgi:proliferating cell nuclear antigen